MFSTSYNIQNHSETHALHVSFNPGMPTVLIPAGETFAMYDVNVMEVLVSSDADAAAPAAEDAPAFSMTFGLQNGP